MHGKFFGKIEHTHVYAYVCAHVYDIMYVRVCL